MSEKKITCLVPCEYEESFIATVKELRKCDAVGNIFAIDPDASEFEMSEDCKILNKGFIHQTHTWKDIVKHVDTPYTLLYAQASPLQLGAYALERMLQVIECTGAGMLYADRYRMMDDVLQPYPVNDYQEGSLRDDFDFGSLLLYRSSALKEAVDEMDVEYNASALYDLRLKISKRHTLFHLQEFLYTELETDLRRSGVKLFDYVDPRHRQVQVEKEKVVTRHLKDIGAWLKPTFTPIAFTGEFPVEATVVIPVRNREKTVEAAVNSVLMQETKFPFNLIVVDNHSTDKTTAMLKEIAAKDARLIHIIPERDDLGIGGCWTEAIMNQYCGKFAIQLDSDDLYIDKDVVQTVVEAFYEQNCAMVVGTYRLVNFDLQEIPPGIIDHKEWTPDNGRNNALRINGLGAPRAFYTPVLREIKIPNTSYGEDYAVGLAISRNYQIGRIYKPLYLCRRWDDNSDASADVKKLNAHNSYKDSIRTIELLARKSKVMKELGQP